MTFGFRPLLAHCDSPGEPPTWMLRKESARSNTATDNDAPLSVCRETTADPATEASGRQPLEFAKTLAQ